MAHPLTSHERSVEVCTVSDIEQELRNLWRDAAQHQQETGHVLTRVCTLTLIAYGADAALAKRVHAAVPAVFGQHPCRAIVIDAAGKADALNAWITTVCQPHDNGEQVCCEFITLTVGETMRPRLPGTVLPLVVSDLPVFVWWPGPWRQMSAVRSQLFGQADRWIIDSADFVEPLEHLAQLSQAITGRHTANVSDLAWTRLTAWRGSVAHVFDQTELFPLLERVEKVSIQAGQQPVGALLAAGWLASRLDWRIETAQRTNAIFQITLGSAHGSVSLEIDLAVGTAPLPTLEIRSDAQQQAVTIACGSNAATIITQTQSVSHTTSHTKALPLHDDGVLLNQELNVHGPDRIFEETLRWLNQLADGVR